MGPRGHTVTGLAVGQERDAARVQVIAKELHRLAAARRVLPEHDVAAAGLVRGAAGDADPSLKNVSCVRAPPGARTSWICDTFPKAVEIRMRRSVGCQPSSRACRNWA